MSKTNLTKPNLFTKKYLPFLILVTLLFGGGITIFNSNNYKILAFGNNSSKKNKPQRFY